MILPIYKDGDTILRLKSEEVKFFNDTLKNLVNDLIVTGFSQNGCVGLSAIQCGIALRVCIIRSNAQQFFKVLINPVILKKDGEQPVMEGCLSIPGVYCLVKRPTKILCQYQDIDGNIERCVIDGFLAAVLSHEVGHMDGILMTDIAEKIV
jgi:peptide deformylase